MKLLGSLTSPYVHKVRVVMAEKELDYEFVLVDVWANDAQIARDNPLGKVPCLILDDGGSLFDSRVIVEYLDSLSSVSPLIPQRGRERAAAKRWEAIADGVLDAATAIQIERTKRPPALCSAAWIQRQEGKIATALDFMNTELSDRPCCMGTKFGLADIAVGSALGYLDLRLPSLDWRAQHSNLRRLDADLAVRPSFVSSRHPKT